MQKELGIGGFHIELTLSLRPSPVGVKSRPDQFKGLLPTPFNNIPSTVVRF